MSSTISTAIESVLNAQLKLTVNKLAQTKMKLIIAAIVLVAVCAKAAELPVQQEMVDACATKLDEMFRDDKEIITKNVDKILKMIDAENNFQKFSATGLLIPAKTQERIEKEIGMSVAKVECDVSWARVQNFIFSTEECLLENRPGNMPALFEAAVSRPGALRALSVIMLCMNITEQD